ncbi:MAG: Na/Pi cotransporter family protein [Anaeroplasmataceae bacterium]
MFETILKVFGGLGIFLFGINLMGDSLKALAGPKMKMIVEKTTNTPLKGILVGTLVTALIQSSSGTTALTVGLVRAGLMTFPQAIGVIMGANIGTTITSFLIGLNISKYSFLFIGIGAFLCFFSKKKKIKELGYVVLGFGLLFFGLDEMGGGLKQILTDNKEFAEGLFTSLSKVPILGLFVGAGLTAVVQSSSATIGILQSLYSTGQIALVGALPILLGSNIGTTVTAVFAGLGGSVEAKRTAVVHTIFNITGALLFMILLTWAYVPLVQWIETNWIPKPDEGNPMMTIAVAHMIFNIVSTFVLFFFIKQMAFVATKIFPDKKQSKSAIDLALSDTKLIHESPTLALDVAKSAIHYMGDQVISFSLIAKQAVFSFEESLFEQADLIEKTVNSLDKRIHDYLILLTKEGLDEKDSQLLSKYLDTIRDLERVADHFMNLLEFSQDSFNSDFVLSDDAKADLEKMLGLVLVMVSDATLAINTLDKDKANQVIANEDIVDTYEIELRNNCDRRVKDGTCDYSHSDHFIDLVSNIERIADHCTNIAYNVVNDKYCDSNEFDH